MEASEPVTVRVSRRFTQSAERVFDAWLDPERLGQWLFSTNTGEMVTVEVDAQVGGGFNITERRGGVNVAHLGTYIEIDRPRRLVFDVSVSKYAQVAERVTVEITPLETGCELTLTHEMGPREGVTPDMLYTGWQMVLEGLEKTLTAREDTRPEAGELPIARAVRTIKASPERVFDAWLNPDQLRKWMFGLEVRNEDIVHLKVNPMVGGSFSFLVRRGEMELDHIGEYLEIDRPRRLAFTWGVKQEEGTEFSRVVVEIAPADDGCELRISHEMAPGWEHFVEKAQGSWQHIADALARALEG